MAREVWVAEHEDGTPIMCGLFPFRTPAKDKLTLVRYVPADATVAAEHDCEVTLTSTDGVDIYQRDCGKPAHLRVNGVPMCADCLKGYISEGLLETVEPLGLVAQAKEGA